MIPTIEEAVVMAHFLKRLTYDPINLTCPANAETCYDFKQGPPFINENCSYHYISLYCEGRGEVRYVAEYYYW